MPAREKGGLKPPPPKIGIVAGNGALPRRLAEHLRAQGTEVFFVGFYGQTDPAAFEGFPYVMAHLGATARVLGVLKKNAVRDLVLIGGMRRPSLAELRADFKTLGFFARYALQFNGDDGFLRALRLFLEGEGFSLWGLQSLMPQLLAPVGLIAGPAADAGLMADIARGQAVLRVTGPLDIGQGVIIQNGTVLGLEGAEGTNALIARCAPLHRKGRGGVLVKMAKPGQDLDLDLPTIGPATLDMALRHGLCAIAVEYGRTLIVDLPEVVHFANSHKLTLVGVSSGD